MSNLFHKPLDPTQISFESTTFIVAQRYNRQSLDRSILHGESIELFRAAIRNPATLDPYERRLIGSKWAFNTNSYIRISKWHVYRINS